MTPGVGAIGGGVNRQTATVTLSLLSAVIWGGSDFLGGIAARRMPASAVVMLSHLLSLGVLVVLAWTLGEALPGHATVLYALAAGLTGGLGVMALYKALALGAMGLTAAVSGVVTAALPVAWAFSTEGLPRAPQITGFVLAAVAIWAIASAPQKEIATDTDSHARLRQGLLLGAVAGISFGALLILLKLAAAHGGLLWPLACARMASSCLAVTVTLFGLRTARRRKTGAAAELEPRSGRRRAGWSALALAGATGVMDASGNTFYTLATQLGRLDIAAVLGSLYPASTILLAALLLKERTTRLQTAGMVLALVAVVLISA